jgi:hypothetical protein
MDPVTVGLVAGAGIQAYGAWAGGQAAAKAARQQAKIKKAQIEELIERMKIQEGRFKEQADSFQAQQIVEFAASGAQIGTGATLVALEDTNMKINQQIDDMKRDTLFKVNQLKMGASVDMQEGNNAATAGAISGFGNLLAGVATAYKYRTETKSTG